MKRTAVTLAMILLPLLLSAQGIGDRELRRLVEDVRLLRSADESVYEDVFRRMEADLSWTPMNETGPLQSSECPPSERIGRFKLNRILSRADAGRKYVSAHGNMLNGEDARYNYSLYERSVRGNSEVTYRFKGREGIQTFVLVPFESGNALSAVLEAEGMESVPFVTDGDLLVAEFSSGELSRDRVLSITVTNSSAAGLSFVLLNHNAGRR